MAPFSLNLTVFYEDTDAGGVVYYANYLKFMERARTAWLRSIGFAPRRLTEERGIIFAVRSVGIDYLAPARLDDELCVEAEIDAIKRVSLGFRQRILRRLPTVELLTQATVRVACLGSVDLRPTPIPTDLAKAMRRVV